MEAIEELALKPCTSSLYLRPFRLCYRQNGTKKFWDFMRTHDRVVSRIPEKVNTHSPWSLKQPPTDAVQRSQVSFISPRSSMSYRSKLELRNDAYSTFQRVFFADTSCLQRWQTRWQRQTAVVSNFRQCGSLDPWTKPKSVSVLIFNTSRQCFVVVKQFRPAVYMCEVERHHPEVFQNQEKESFSHLEDPLPAVVGVTYELCAGIVDKPDLSLEEIACGEVLEECGYRVPVTDLRRITSYRSGVGVTGSRQTLFYVEVTDQMRTGEGGGQPEEGELIEVVEIPLEDSMKFAYDETLPKTMGVIFSFMWFQNNIAPKLPKK